MKLRDRSNRNLDKVDSSGPNSDLNEQNRPIKKMANKKKKPKRVLIKEDEELENNENSFKAEENHSESKYFSESKTEEDNDKNQDEEIEPVKLRKKSNNKKAQSKEEIPQPKQTSKKTANKSTRKASSSSKKGHQNEKKEESKIKTEPIKIEKHDLTSGDDDEEDSGDDWEEVEMAPCETLDVAISKETLQVTVDTKKQKKPTDVKAKMERMFKMMQKKLGVCIIKTHLLCFLNHGFYLNKLSLDPLVRSFHLSMNHFQQPSNEFKLKNLNEKYLVKYLNTIKNLFEFEQTEEQFLSSNILITRENLIEAITKTKCENYLQYVLLVLIGLRNMSIKARLCVCFEVYSFKEGTKLTRKQPQKRKPQPVSDSDEDEDEDEEDLNDDDERPTTSKRSSSLRKQTKRIKKEKKELSSAESECEDSFDEDFKVETLKSKKKRSTTSNKSTKSNKNSQETIKVESVSDIQKKLTKSTKAVKNSKILSDDGDQNEVKDVKIEQTETIEEDKKTDHRHYWLEVYLEKEQRWCSVEPYNLKVNEDSLFEKRFGQRILYVCSYDNDNRVKDVTKRYADEWATNTRLLRVSHLDEKKLWWETTLLRRQPLDANLDIQEEIQLKAKLLEKPKPISVSELKDHPLYVLKRHLLKYQSVYPADAKPVGHLKDEPIYSRDNLVLLHSRQTWLKFARMVKPFEQAYKIVKGRLKKSEHRAGCRENPDLDLYGFWQTKPYEPPIAENGRVPRNDFGNVELFQPCMLPIGCAHLRNMPFLNRVCRKLNIDCAAAVVGFDAHGGFSHAVYDGWVICEEFKEVVVAAFQEEEREAAKRMIQKNHERILGNWANLVKMVLLREKLKKKYENKKSLINNAATLNKTDAKKLSNLDDEIKVGAKLNLLEEPRENHENEKESNKEESDVEKPVILSKAKKRNRAKASTQRGKRKTQAKKKKMAPSTSDEEEKEYNDDDDTTNEDEEVDEYEEDYKPTKRSTRSKRVAANKKSKSTKSEKQNEDVEMDSIEEDESTPKNGRPVLEIGKIINLPKKNDDDDVNLSESDDE